ncbi:hypothetical protein FA13DRAFT_1752303 [Coprinellus micaceus]|uniref:Uncharacterized protein n=1 Tax=Coprinellus micaceus TaxID=71717 RepID=A0A4Y7TTQ6_COPMI|nr:hypothetical protein FA13DRAFT_1752303 [Coprinellus micaceus]
MSLRNPFAELATIALGKSDLHSIFCLVVFCIVTLVLAYLTNPTENSFRTYLTEQSFRHHLSRLDDTLDSEHGVHEGLASRSLHPACISRSAKAPTADRNGPFHFANRASISLRTPKHVFHSFAIFTIAAMVPVQKGNSSQSDETDGWSISDSWYIGAFGKWWRGGVWETWYQDVIARSKDEEGWNSGILSMKNLDMLPDFHGSFLPKTLPYHLSKQSPPKLRNRDHPVRKSPSRSSSPPPLSKTASLPLHTKRVPATSQSERCDFLPQTKSCMPPVATHSMPSRSTTFDQSPVIAEVLPSVQDLRTQYSEYQATASQSRQILTIELDSHRERKRQEDASRLEMKSKTKQLDDQKRTAEGLKRDAERKLKSARATRDNALQRIEYLDREVGSLQDRTKDDRAFLAQKGADVSGVEQELSQALELKRSEIKAAEEALLTLNQKLATERERLESLKEKAQRRLKEQQQSSPALLGRSVVDGPADPAYQARPHATEPNGYLYPAHELPAHALDSPSSPVHPDAAHASLHPYGIYSEDIPLADSPSGDVNGYSPVELDLSPVIRRTQQAYPIGHSSSDHRMETSKSLHLENDPAFNKTWNGSLYSLPSMESASATASRFGKLTDAQPPALAHDRDPSLGAGSMNGYYAWSRQDSGITDELGFIRDDFSSLVRGLNPSAKAFSLPRKHSPPGPLNSTNPGSMTYDALNPNGLVTSVLPSASSSLLRAFAPSRAEREALQRALGGSTNNSLERLPSLSEVGSIPSSPTHVHASALSVNPLDLAHTRTAKDSAATKTFNLPSWLTALPNIKKSRFKPWDDDEPLPTTNGNVE